MSAETPDRYNPTRESLLHELEDVKSSLLGNDVNKMPLEFESQIDTQTENTTDNTPNNTLDNAAPTTDEEFNVDDELFNEAVIVEEDDIPELHDAIPSTESPTLAEPAPAITLPPHVLPGQQSLFDDHPAVPVAKEPTPSQAEVPVQEKAALPQAKGENPFLPPEIRQRLSQNKDSMLEDLADVGESLAKHATDLDLAVAARSTNSPSDNTATDALVDKLVAKYLPKIEQELREQLQQHVLKNQQNAD